MSGPLRAGPPASRAYADIPPCGAGQAIGLHGGSFNPPHAGHRHVSLIALSRLGLDQLWWLVSPGNPLKEHAQLASLAERMREAACVASHPRIVVTGLEAVHGIRFTADLAAFLSSRLRPVRFVWIMGSDNLVTFHRWERWRVIADRFPIAVINRPGSLAAPVNARAAVAMARYRVDERDAGSLAGRRPPAWTFLTAPRTGASSTILRLSTAPGVNEALRDTS